MKYFKINGNLNEEVADAFITEVNKDKEPITIYISSSGGSAACTSLLTEIINDQPGRFMLVAIEKVHSAAFELLYSVRCITKILPGTLGSYHLGRCAIEMLDSGEPYYDSDKFYWTQRPMRVQEQLLFCKSIGFNEKELKEMQKGSEVNFSTQRLMELGQSRPALGGAYPLTYTFTPNGNAKKTEV